MEPLLETESGAWASIWAVLCCKASIALTGSAASVAFPLKFKEVSSRSAWLLDDARLLWPNACVGGGGGNACAPAAVFGDSFGLAC